MCQVIENMKAEIAETEEGEEAATMLLRLAKETEELALRESECFSPILKRWYLVAAGVASVSLHQCYGSILMQYLAGRSTITKETVEVLQTAGKLEKVLVQMVAEDSEECEDGGKGLVREMVPYEIDSIILRLLRQWIDEKLQTVQECLSRAKEAEVGLLKLYLQFKYTKCFIHSIIIFCFCRHGTRSQNQNLMHNLLES